MNIRLRPGNIWSGSTTLAVFTNPTEIAFRKCNLRKRYPVRHNGVVYPDSESLYHALANGRKGDTAFCYKCCITALTEKFNAYPYLIGVIRFNGGVAWLEKCSHVVYGRSPRWEGVGRKSGFIRCLITVYESFVKIGGES